MPVNRNYTAETRAGVVVAEITHSQGRIKVELLINPLTVEEVEALQSGLESIVTDMRQANRGRAPRVATKQQILDFLSFDPEQGLTVKDIMRLVVGVRATIDKALGELRAEGKIVAAIDSKKQGQPLRFWKTGGE